MVHRERVYRTEAIVLRRIDFGEADRLLTVFTPERGKLKLIAKGARKPSSRKSGHVELFSRGQFLVAVGRELDILTQAETVEPFLLLRKDLLRTTYAYYVAELADAFTAERDENQPLYDLLKDALGWLCIPDEGSTEPSSARPAARDAAAGGGSQPEPEAGRSLPRAGWSRRAELLALAARTYEIHLLGLVGYQPQLFVCGSCKRQLEPVVNYLSAADGSVFCPRCGHDRVGATAISVNALKVLRFLQTHDWDTCRLLRLSPASHAEVERTMNQYITYHLERRLKSVDFMHHLRQQMGLG
jgi:DNA repair protein RecO (recombination protein O)